MKKIYSPSDEGELALIRSILDSAGIPYKLTNEYFGSLYAGPAMGGINQRHILVEEKYIHEAQELLSHFIKKQNSSPQIQNKLTLTFFAKLVDKIKNLLATNK